MLREQFVGHNNKVLPAKAHGFRPQAAQVSYFIGNDESKHQRGVNTYERVNLGDIYPGINIHVRATGNNIEKIFTVAPHQNPQQIQVKLSGATKLEINEQGERIAHTDNGSVAYTAPIAFQETANGEKESVSVAYALNATTNTYGFTLGQFDTNRPLIIDPLIRSSYLGAAGAETAYALAIHPTTGEVYVAGTTQSATPFPGVSGGAQTSYSGGGNDAFVSRFSADLTTLIVSTYLGAAGADVATALAFHPATGEVYVAGYTNSPASAFPGVGGGAQTSFGGIQDAFVSRFNANLTTLIQSTYLGAAGNDVALALAIHPISREIYAAGRTGSAATTFPGVSGGAQDGSGGGNDAFVSRFNSLSGRTCNLDMDGDTLVTATKEGLVLLRGMLGLTDGASIAGTGITAGQWAAVRPFFNANLDMDGDTLLTSSKEGLVLLRAMLGFTGTATTAGTGITAAQWTAARPLINANCGTNFAP